MLQILLLSVIYTLVSTYFTTIQSQIDSEISNPDVGLSTVQMVRRRGYKIEELNVQTSDGYILRLHRMPYGKNNFKIKNKLVAFLMHGVLSSSADWVNMGPNKSLAYQLVDAGYDVWMGNARGNKWSRKHISFDPDKDPKFWNFSWHEIGVTDLPTMIDYILGATNQKKLFYVGHSQGTTTFFVMASMKPEYNKKIKLMVALAPVAFVSNMKNPMLQRVSIFHDSLEWVTSSIGADEFLPSNKLLESVSQTSCKDDSLVQEVCSNLLFMIAGTNAEQLNKSTLPVITSNAPAGASTKQLLHYAQEIISGKFRQYDHGPALNLLRYGNSVPPDYNVRAISAPVGLFYSSNDLFVDLVDVKKLSSKLPNLVQSYLVSDKKFNHLDFLYAINCRELLYNHVLSLMKQFA